MIEPHVTLTPTADQVADGRRAICAPAKLNLGLKVLPVRPDGYHDIESWMVPLSWHDTLWITPDGPLELRIHGRSAGIPAEIENNLVGRAALALARDAGIKPTGVIELHKVVPPGGGLGGGSSDAAAALLALNRAWKTDLREDRLARIAATLGSDVAFFLTRGPAYCSGRGEILRPMPAYNPLFAVLLIPPQGIATKAVYEAFDRGHRPARTPDFDWPAWAGMTAEELNTVLCNDLEPAAFYLAPWLAELRDRASALAKQGVHMTGSGSTLFTLCPSAFKTMELKLLFQDYFRQSCACVSARILCQRR